MILPDEAVSLLDRSAPANPGPWVGHSRNVARAARLLAERAGGQDPDRAFVCGLLHDIGRSRGKGHLRHVLAGYRMLEGLDLLAASVCLSHSFPNRNLGEYQGEPDLDAGERRWLGEWLETAEYGFHDRLIQLCDGLADAKGFTILERRWMDVSIRNGVNDRVVEKWRTILAFKRDLEASMGESVEHVLGL